MTRPAFWHNLVVQDLNLELGNYLRKHPIGLVLNPENLYAITPRIRLAPADK